jgi:rifampin ADP-ribosylating transferase
MQFEPDNNIVKLCAKGMELEGEGKNEEASKVFLQAWEQATGDKEKFIAAHYVARQQQSIAGKLSWDATALDLALKIKDDSVKGAYPSLYLNIAKGYEDLKEFEKAAQNYETALTYVSFLHEDGYGKMIMGGIENGLKRIETQLKR